MNAHPKIHLPLDFNARNQIGAEYSSTKSSVCIIALQSGIQMSAILIIGIIVFATFKECFMYIRVLIRTFIFFCSRYCVSLGNVLCLKNNRNKTRDKDVFYVLIKVTGACFESAHASVHVLINIFQMDKKNRFKTSFYSTAANFNPSTRSSNQWRVRKAMYF